MVTPAAELQVLSSCVWTVSEYDHPYSLAAPEGCRVSRRRAHVRPHAPRLWPGWPTVRSRPGIRPCAATRPRRQGGPSGQRPARRRRGLVRTSDDARWPIADQRNGSALARKLHVEPPLKTPSLLRPTLHTPPCPTPL